jgi:hypothetical protein
MRAGTVANPARVSVRWLRRRAKRTLAVGWGQGLRFANRWRRASVLGPAPVAVSLTSHGTRIDDVALTVESIAAGSVRPGRLVLWLDDPDRFASLPASLLRLQRRGLEVRLTENYGPHTKYFPYVTSRQGPHTVPLVTADDDVLYPPWWLRTLLAEHRAMPEAVHCYRASVVRVDGDRIAPYDQWPRCKDREANVARFATGVSGVIYPVRMLEELRDRGDAFRAVCPRADDIWLHWVALRTGTAVRQVSRHPVHFPVIRGSQEVTLVSGNVHAGGNDTQIRALYEPEDVSRLRQAGAPVRTRH